MRDVTEIVCQNKEWEETLSKTPFNFLGVKIYYSFTDSNGKAMRKSVEWHTDVGHTRDGRPTNEAQVPGTPVAILTHGGSKNFWFRRHRGKDARVGRLKAETNQNSTIHIQQKNGSLVVLDTRDEMPDACGWCWQHKSDLIGEPKTTITHSFIFRCVHVHEFVHPITNKLISPRTTATKTGWFRSAHYKKQMTSAHYQKTRDQIEQKMKALWENK
jgi:hypothetical protein